MIPLLHPRAQQNVTLGGGCQAADASLQCVGALENRSAITFKGSWDLGSKISGVALSTTPDDTALFVFTGASHCIIIAASSISLRAGNMIELWGVQQAGDPNGNLDSVYEVNDLPEVFANSDVSTTLISADNKLFNTSLDEGEHTLTIINNGVTIALDFFLIATPTSSVASTTTVTFTPMSSTGITTTSSSSGKDLPAQTGIHYGLIVRGSLCPHIVCASRQHELFLVKWT